MFSALLAIPLQTVVARPDALPEVSGDQLVDGALNLVFLALAAISMIVLTLQGIKYSLSAGDEEKTRSARNGIIYSLVGVTIAVTSWSLFNFVLERIIRPTTHLSEESSITNLFVDIVGLMLLVAGIITIIMILVSAIKMVFAGGNADKIKSARKTIIYALIGAVVASLAGPILSFVLSRL